MVPEILHQQQCGVCMCTPRKQLLKEPSLRPGLVVKEGWQSGPYIQTSNYCLCNTDVGSWFQYAAAMRTSPLAHTRTLRAYAPFTLSDFLGDTNRRSPRYNVPQGNLLVTHMKIITDFWGIPKTDLFCKWTQIDDYYVSNRIA